jgi:acetyl esterase
MTATHSSLADRFPELDSTYARLLDATRASGTTPTSELDPLAMRKRVHDGDALCASGPDMLDVADDLVDADLPVRHYVPHRLRTDTVIVWFHGGGWVTGDFGYSDAFCRLLADGVGCEVRSVEYRLAPENPFPAAVEDALRAVRWAAAGRRRIVVAGDSAGGNLAAVAVQQLSGDPEVRLAGQVLVYPVLDADRGRSSYVRNDGLVLGILEMGWFFDQYAPNEDDRRSPRFAPARAVRLAGLPPAVIAVAGHDPLLDEGVEYARRLGNSGVPVNLLEFPSLVHGFLRFTGPVPAAADAAARVVAAAAALVNGQERR